MKHDPPAKMQSIRRTLIRATQLFINFLIVLSLCGFDCSSSQSYTGNIALSKTVKQLKTFGGDVSGRLAWHALDGNTQTSNSSGCATSDNSTGNNWWQVDLGVNYVITSITLFIPQTSADGDVSSSSVYVGTISTDFTSQPTCVSFSGPSGIPAGGSQTFNCSQLLFGRFITVMKNVPGQYLSICEFMATGSEITSPFQGNIAFNKRASLLQTFGGDVNGRLARYAVDGNNDTSNENICAQGDSPENNQWQVDLGDTYAITSVTLFIPQSSTSGVSSVRFTNIAIGLTSNVAGQPVCVSFGDYTGITAGQSGTFPCSQVLIGRYVTITKTITNDLLTVCEVIVSGYPLYASSTTSPTTTTTTTTTTTVLPSSSTQTTATTTQTTTSSTTSPTSTTTTSLPSSSTQTTRTTTLTSSNIAFNKSATLLKTFGGPDTGRLARYAVDGNNDTSNENICAQGDSDDYNQWQVDLGDMYVITSVTLFIPQSPTSGVTSVRSTNIAVGLTSNVTVQPVCVSFGDNTGIALGQSGTFLCSQVLIGRYVTITKTMKNDILTVCEIIVSGYPSSESTQPTSSTTTISLLSSTTASSTIQNSPTGDGGLSQSERIGIIVGVIVGFFVLVLIVIFLYFFVTKRERRALGPWFKNRFSIKAPDITRLHEPVCAIPMDVSPGRTRENIPVDQLEAFIKQKKSKADIFTNEFKSLPKDFAEKVTFGSLPENKSKNRFKNVLPFDHTIVPIKTPDGGVYINANFIRGYKDTERTYIATQGPNERTIHDFWLMVWQHNVNRIVMITRLFENGKKKCERYWPSGEHETKDFGGIIVTMSFEEVFADFTIRQFAVQNEDEQSSRMVSHLHYTSFDDKTRPSQIYPLIAFRNRVRQVDDTATGPLVVHCSAGVGRTGTFIALDYLLNQAQSDNEVNVFGCVEDLRHQRMNLVQTQDQYIFLHEAVLDGVTVGVTAIRCTDYISFYNEACQLDGYSDDPTSSLVQQFKLLEKLKAAPTDRVASHTVGINVLKNRSVHIVAFDDCSPKLLTPTPYKDGNEYINAVYVDSLHKKDAYVLTQMPLPWTVYDFWRMIFDFQMSTIVLLDGDDSINSGDCPAYWPTESSKIEIGSLCVELVSSKESELGLASVEVRSLVVSKIDTSESVEVQQFQLLNWPAGQVVPENSAILTDLMNGVMHWHQTNKAEEGAIVVQCCDGATRSGLFATSCYLVDKMKVDQEVDVFLSSRVVTTQRPKSIDNFEQYKFLYDVAATSLTQYNEYANVSSR